MKKFHMQHAYKASFAKTCTNIIKKRTKRFACLLFISSWPCTAWAQSPPSSFEEAWKFVRQAPQGIEGKDARQIDAELEKMVRTKPEWMLRCAALNALEKRNAVQTPRLAIESLNDAVPRVREAAAQILKRYLSYPLAADGLIRLAKNDEWPFVRSAAVLSLGGYQPVRGALIDIAKKDHSGSVRLAVWRAFRENRVDVPLEAIKEGLLNAKTRDGAIETIEYVKASCVASAAEFLYALVKRGESVTDPNTEDHISVAVQARAALYWIGSPLAKEADRILGTKMHNATKLSGTDLLGNTRQGCPAANSK